VELLNHFNRDYQLMSENLRVMNNRMVLLNPLVSLLKKNPPITNANSTGGVLTPKTAGTNVSGKGVQYVNSGGEETGD
jgi:hypothetical protein